MPNRDEIQQASFINTDQEIALSLACCCFSQTILANAILLKD